MKQKKLFRVPVSWLMQADMVVYADNLDEAFKLAEDMDIPENGEYVDSTFEINYEVAKYINN